MTSSAPKVSIPKIKLADGNEIPLLALGTARTSGDSQDLINALKYAISIGYRHIDAAWISFIDAALERGIKEAIKESNGSVKREDLYLTCKLWNIFHAKDLVPVGLNDTLKNMGLDYLDLYYIHYPVAFQQNPGKDPYPRDAQGNVIFSDVNYLETYEAMEELCRKGLIKSIGLANFNLDQIQDVLKACKIKPAVVQVELHPYLQNDEIVQFCLNNNIAVVAFAPFGAGDLSYAREDIPTLLQDETLVRIGQKYNKSPAQVCVRWCLQRGCIPAARALLPEQILENAMVFDFQLSAEDMQEIKKLNRDMRIFTHADMKGSQFYPFKESSVKFKEEQKAT